MHWKPSVTPRHSRSWRTTESCPRSWPRLSRCSGTAPSTSACSGQTFRGRRLHRGGPTSVLPAAAPGTRQGTRLEGRSGSRTRASSLENARIELPVGAGMSGPGVGAKKALRLSRNSTWDRARRCAGHRQDPEIDNETRCGTTYLALDGHRWRDFFSRRRPTGATPPAIRESTSASMRGRERTEGDGVADIAHLVGHQRMAIGLEQRGAVLALERQAAGEGAVIGGF